MQRQSLSELDIPVLLVNPESEDQLEQMIELVSTATNTKENADALLSYIDEQKKRGSEKRLIRRRYRKRLSRR